MATGLPVSVSAAVVTKFFKREDETVLHLFAMGADNLTEAVPLLGTIEILARNKGAAAVELCAPETRMGWVRALRGRGYAPDRQEADGMILRKRL